MPRIADVSVPKLADSDVVRVSLADFQKERSRFVRLAHSGLPVLVSWKGNTMLLGFKTRAEAEILNSELAQARINEQLAALDIATTRCIDPDLDV